MQVAPDPDGPLLQRDWEECLLNHIIIKINTDILSYFDSLSSLSSCTMCSSSSTGKG